MKTFTRSFMLLGALALSLIGSRASAADVFNHLSLAVTAGSDGIGGEIAMPVTKVFALRLGGNYMPQIKLKTNLSRPKWREDWDRVEIEGKTSWKQFKALLDIYVWPAHGFHFTAGLYVAPREVVKIQNPVPVVDDEGNGRTDLGFIFGDYILYPDQNGMFSARVLTKGLRPYLGLGFGRAIPKRRVNFTFDAGVQLWGTPKLYASDGKGGEYHLENKDAEEINIKSGSLMRKLSKIRCYPSITLRLAGRIF